MNTLNEPIISVIVPIFKIERYLPQCIESLLNQSFKDFELILVNDGSPDACPEICDSYAKKDARIKVVHKNNGGLLSARKAGLKAAKGTYISFVDGDDWVDPYFLDILHKLAVTNGSDLVVTGHFREFDGKIETIKPEMTGTFPTQEIRNSLLPKAIYTGRFCEHGISTYVWNKLFNRHKLEKILYDVPNDIVMGEDAAITYAYLSVAAHVTISSITLYYYRQRHDSIVKSVEDPQMEYYRLGLLMKYLKSKLSGVLEPNNLNEQISYYLYSQILVRSGGLIYDSKGKLLFNPFSPVEPNSRVVVYSSGSFGQHILSTNAKYPYFTVSEWLDFDYHELTIGGNQVRPCSSILNSDFDHLIIATINPKNFDWIKEELSLMGVDGDKVVNINTDMDKISALLIRLGFDDNFGYLKEPISYKS